MLRVARPGGSLAGGPSGVADHRGDGGEESTARRMVRQWSAVAE